MRSLPLLVASFHVVTASPSDKPSKPESDLYHPLNVAPLISDGNQSLVNFGIFTPYEMLVEGLKTTVPVAIVAVILEVCILNS